MSNTALPSVPLTESKKRIVWLDMLRAFAIFLVVVIHASSQNFYNVSVFSSDWIAFAVYDCLAHIAVPLFVMISGALFLDERRSISIKRLYQKNILRIFTAFLFWSSINVLDIIINAYREKGTADGLDATELLGTFVTGRGVMWFVFMIIGLYIITPLLRCITKYDNYTKYFLILWFVMGSVLPAVFEVGKLSGWEFISYLSKAYNKINFTFALKYSGYYVLGHYLLKNDIKPSARKMLYVFGVSSALFCILITVFVSQGREKAYVYFINNYISPNLVLCAAALFLFFKYTVSQMSFSLPCLKVVNSVSSLSFGIYFMHMFILGWLERWKITSVSFSGWLSVPILSVVVFLASWIIIFVVSKIPFFNKHII